ncbi:cation efflux protein [Haematococcus lacustris]
MSVAAYVVVEDSGMALYKGLALHQLPDLETGAIMFGVLCVATVLKLACYVICVNLQHKSDSMLALAEDHLNDVMSNVGAIITAAIASQVPSAWWADPAGGIAISLFILWRWYDIAKTQVEKIVGVGAPLELLEHLKRIADAHNPQMEVDCLRAFHFGSRYMVEAEVVMPLHYTLREVHDISLELQNRLEALDLVERAFVHVDYERRTEPEHRTERLLAGLPVLAEQTVFSSDSV